MRNVKLVLFAFFLASCHLGAVGCSTNTDEKKGPVPEAASVSRSRAEADPRAAEAMRQMERSTSAMSGKASGQGR